MLPGDYGAYHMFQYSENFLTPRLPAEALVLGAVAAALGSRYIVAVVCLLAAGLLHPIMAAAGVALLTVHFVAISRPKLALGVFVTLAVAAVLAVAAGAPLPRLDGDWLAVVKLTSPYLFISTWSLDDWGRIAVPLSALAIGLLTSSSPLVRRLCGSALITVACSFAMTALCCDLLHIVIITQLQPWRWLWLANVLAILLIPVIARDSWRTGDSGRTAAVLFGIAWILHGESNVMLVTLLAVVCAAIPPARVKDTIARLLFRGSCVLLVIAVMTNIANKLLYVMDSHSADTWIVIRWLRVWAADGVLPTLLIASLAFALESSASLRRNAFCVAAAALVCIGLGPAAWASWSTAYYTPALRDKFADWRQHIPVHAEVIWPDTPVGAWYFLERPSYWSPHQVAGSVFSRAKTVTMQQRTEWIAAALDHADPASESPARHRSPLRSVIHWTPAALTSVCRTTSLQYLVTWSYLGRPALQPVTPNPARPNGHLYLYSCADFKG